MKKSSFFKNLIGCLAVVLIVAASALTTTILLKEQEKQIIGKTNLYMYESASGEITLPNTDTSPSYSEYLAMMTATKAGSVSITEPTNEEINIEQAAAKARNELQKLMNAQIIPENDIREGVALYDLRYVSYMLEGVSERTRYGIWEVQFSSTSDMPYSINVVMDAMNGKILMLELMTQQMNIEPKAALTAFSEYLGIADKTVQIYSDDKNPSFASIVFEDDCMVLIGYFEADSITVSLDITTAGIDRVMLGESAVKNENEK